MIKNFMKVSLIPLALFFAAGCSGQGSHSQPQALPPEVNLTPQENPISQTIQTSDLCGDGQVNAGEECDNGNTVDGDGCSHDCRIEEIARDTRHYVHLMYGNLPGDSEEQVIKDIIAIWNKHLPGIDVNDYEENDSNLKNFFAFIRESSNDVFKTSLKNVNGRIQAIKDELEKAKAETDPAQYGPDFELANNELSALNPELERIQKVLKAIADIYHVAIDFPDPSDAVFSQFQTQFVNDAMHVCNGKIFLATLHASLKSNFSNLVENTSFTYKDENGNTVVFPLMTFHVP